MCNVGKYYVHAKKLQVEKMDKHFNGSTYSKNGIESNYEMKYAVLIEAFEDRITSESVN